MDPTKNFDHLDPKLKDTYARVMGTAPTAPGNIAQPAAINPASLPPQNQPVTSMQNPNIGPNPGTGPTVNSVPMESSTVVTQPAPDMNAPTNSTFFSNPSPATTNPAQAPVQAGA